MPYSRLPARLRQMIPAQHGQDLFRNVFNSQLKSGKTESVAFASAWAALQNAGYSKTNGQWVKKSSDSMLQNKLDEWNEKYAEKHGKITLGMLRDVYDRGVGAYRTNPESVRPNVNSPEQWAAARVNSFLSAARGAKSINHDKDIHDKIKKSSPTASSVHVPSAEWEKAETYKAPAGARAAAARAIRWKEKHGDEVKGGTQVGWTRAGQLARGENLSRETVARMASFFARHKGNEAVDPKYKDTPWRDAGYIMHLAWGGSAGRKWSQGIMDRLKKSINLAPFPVESGVSSNRVEHPSQIFSSAYDNLGPRLAVFSLKSDVASVAKQAEHIGAPFFCADAGSDAKSLLVIPLSKISIPVEPSSDVVWNEVQWNIGGNKVVCLSRDDSPSSQVIFNLGTSKPDCTMRKFLTSVRASDVNRSRKPDVFSKLNHVVDVCRCEGEPVVDFYFSNAPVCKNEASPVSCDRAVSFEEIFIPQVRVRGLYTDGPRAVVSKDTLIFKESADSSYPAANLGGDFSGANSCIIEFDDFFFFEIGKWSSSPATTLSNDASATKNLGHSIISNAKASGSLSDSFTAGVEINDSDAGLFWKFFGHVACYTLGGNDSQVNKRQIDDDTFTMPDEARMRSMELGLGGAIHVSSEDGQQAVYMPGASHEDYLEMLNRIAGIEPEEDDEEEPVNEGLIERAISAIIGAIMQHTDVNKSFEETKILKVDDEQRIVYGWASVVTEDGEPVVDSQGDVIEPEEMVKMANDFMLAVRTAKAMHKGDKIGEVIHSMPLTAELAKALGLHTDMEGWIVGVKVYSDDVWASVKSGEFAGFSIGGRASSREKMA